MYDYGAQRGTMPVGGLHAAATLYDSCFIRAGHKSLGRPREQPQSSESGTISPGGADATIRKLLQQSHDLDQQLPVWDRATLLSRQTEMVSRLRPDLGRDWADELFRLSSQMKGEDQRSFAQNHAGI